MHMPPRLDLLISRPICICPIKLQDSIGTFEQYITILYNILNTVFGVLVSSKTTVFVFEHVVTFRNLSTNRFPARRYTVDFLRHLICFILFIIIYIHQTIAI